MSGRILTGPANIRPDEPVGMLIRKQTPLPAGMMAAPFIVGVARSGTTLLRMMLDAHSQLGIPPETHFIPEVAKAVQDAGENAREVFLGRIVESRVWKDFRIDPASLRARLETSEPFQIGPALRAFYQLYVERFGKTRWGDKTPTYLTQMRLIQNLLPEACFIHVIRDGRDIVLSVKDLWFGPGTAVEAAENWIERITAARSDAAHLQNYLEIRYEDLVLETETTLRKVCAFIDLPWEAGMLEYHRGADERLAEISHDVKAADGKRIVKAEQRVGIHARTAQQPDASRIGRWKSEMPTTEREQFEKIARPMLAELGYLE